jgi:hypothetical protein
MIDKMTTYIERLQEDNSEQPFFSSFHDTISRIFKESIQERINNTHEKSRILPNSNDIPFIL